VNRPSVAARTTASPATEAVCAVIVTYHPDAGLADRIEKVIKQVGQIVIVDNGSQGAGLQQIRDVVDRLAVHLISNASNEGIARALNTGVRWAESRGYLWVLTLDQDSIVAADMVSSLLDVFHDDQFPEKVAVIGSNFRDKVSGRTLCDDMIRPASPSGCEMKTVLTSGSLVSVDAFRSIGGFREDFFVDCVDHEYCLRARSRGYRILMTAKVVMEHGLGVPTEHRLLWGKFGTSNHSPLRRYLMARNIMILVREYLDKEPAWIVRCLWIHSKSMLLVCLFEKQRISKVKGTIRGCIDGIMGRTRFSGD